MYFPRFPEVSDSRYLQAGAAKTVPSVQSMPSQLALFYQTVLGYQIPAGLPRENLLRLKLLGYHESTLNSDSNNPPNSNMQNKVFDDKINWLSFIRRCWVTLLGYPQRTYSNSSNPPSSNFYQTGYPAENLLRLAGLPTENLLRLKQFPPSSNLENKSI